jgi:hypothetical protein
VSAGAPPSPSRSAAHLGWLNIACEIARVYQGALMELLGALDPADLDRVDKAIYNTFGLAL